MEEHLKIEQELQQREEWLRKRRELVEAISTSKHMNFELAYSYEGTGCNWITRTVSVSKETQHKITEILNKELEDFDKKGFEGWLKERED